MTPIVFDIHKTDETASGSKATAEAHVFCRQRGLKSLIYPVYRHFQSGLTGNQGLCNFITKIYWPRKIWIIIQRPTQHHPTPPQYESGASGRDESKRSTIYIMSVYLSISLQPSPNISPYCYKQLSSLYFGIQERGTKIACFCIAQAHFCNSHNWLLWNRKN